MGLIDRLLHRSQIDGPTETSRPPACPHFSLTPRWDSAEGVGHEDKVTAFRCEGCGQLFSPDEARYLHMSRDGRLRELGRPSKNWDGA